MHALVNGGDVDDMEVTDEDMNNPELLAMLDEISGGGGAHKGIIT